MSNLATTLKERIESYKRRATNLREEAKAVTLEVATTGVAMGTAAALGALDEAKGTATDKDWGIATYKVGPVEASLLAAGVGKAARLAMLKDDVGLIAGAFGTGGGCAWSYVQGRRGWKRHAAQPKT